MLEELRAAVQVADCVRLDAIITAACSAAAAGEIDDDHLSAVYEAVTVRRRDIADHPSRAAGAEVGRRFAPRRPQRTPDRQRSLERRRQLAGAGPLPPRLCSAFTTGQLAVLRVVADEVILKGACDRSLDEIAARAGVSRTLVKAAVREATRLGLLSVEHRPRPGQKNLPNVVRIVSSEWQAWLRTSPRAIGGRMLAPTSDSFFSKTNSRVPQLPSGLVSLATPTDARQVGATRLSLPSKPSAKKWRRM